MKNVLLVIASILILSVPAHAVEPLEGFMSLKIGKNINECLKEGGFKATPFDDAVGTEYNG